jgi:hypothetical protein
MSSIISFILPRSSVLILLIAMGPTVVKQRRGKWVHGKKETSDGGTGRACVERKREGFRTSFFGNDSDC